MNLEEFEKEYATFKARERIEIICCNCNDPKTIYKHKAKNNIEKNGKYVCQACRTKESASKKVFSEEARQKISRATSYKRSPVTKQKMALAKTAFFKTKAGLELKKKLSVLTARGHAENKYENSKRNGWHESPKAGKVFYGSSYELLYCLDLDQDDNVKTYQTQIAYEVEGRGRCLDFLVTYQDDSLEASEVKPSDRMGEQANIDQINDSAYNAAKEGWGFRVITEDYFGMTCKEIRDQADEHLSKTTDTDWAKIRKESNRKRAKKHYDNKIAQDKVQKYCEYCKETHSVLRKSYDANIERNGRYICEREGGHIAGKKPGKKKVNPYAKDGKKQCNRCKDVKPFEEFSPDKSKTDGYSTRCKECRAEVYRERYQNKK